MKGRNRVTILNIISTFLLTGISIFTAPVFSRLLGTDGYGIAATYTVWVGIFTTVGTAQTQCTIPNARIEYPLEKSDSYQSAIMAMSLTMFACLSVVVVLLLPLLSSLMNIGKPLILLMLFHAVGSFGISFLNSKFVYELKAGRNMLLSTGITLATLALSLLFVISLPKEINYLGRILGNAGVYGLVGIVACVWILIKGRTLYSPQYWKFCFVLAVPLAFHCLADQLLGHSDLLMIQKMEGNSFSGMYGLAYNFSAIMFSIFGALNNSWVPFFFEGKRQNNQELVHQQATNYLEIYTVLSVGFILLAPEVYKIFADSSFWEGSKLIPVFVMSYYINFLCTFPVNYEYYCKKTRMVAVTTVVSCIINIGLNILLISKLGMMGAAVATCISHCVQFSMHYGYSRFILGKEDYPFGWKKWGKYALAYVAVMAVVYATPDLWLARWCFGAAIGLWELLKIKKRKVLI